MESATQGSEKIVIPDAVLEAHGLGANATTTDQSQIDEDGFTPKGTPAVTPTTTTSAATPTVAEIEAQPDLAAGLSALLEQLSNDAAERRATQPITKEVAPSEPEVPPALRAALESENPEVKALAEQLLIQQRETARIETERAQETEARLTAAFERQINDCKTGYNLNDNEVRAITDRLTSNPGLLAGGLTFEDGVHLLFPGRARGVVATPTTTTNGAGRPIVKVPASTTTQPATLVNGSSGGGAPAQPQAAPEGETMESAVDRGFRAVFGGA